MHNARVRILGFSVQIADVKSEECGMPNYGECENNVKPHALINILTTYETSQVDSATPVQ